MPTSSYLWRKIQRTIRWREEGMCAHWIAHRARTLSTRGMRFPYLAYQWSLVYLIAPSRLNANSSIYIHLKVIRLISIALVDLYSCTCRVLNILSFCSKTYYTPRARCGKRTEIIPTRKIVRLNYLALKISLPNQVLWFDLCLLTELHNFVDFWDAVSTLM